jgi:flagellar basal-body rod protein FlgC
MGFLDGLNISGTALTAQRLRMDVVSSNLANADTTRAQMVNGKWVPYQRKMVTFSPINGSFSGYLSDAMGSNTSQSVGGGVQVSQIVNDPTPFKVAYDPTNPDADANGYVQMPNVDPLKEMVDLMGAQRSYEANVTVMNAQKSILLKALEIGK